MSAIRRRKLFVFDQSVSAGSPAGSCVLAEVAGMSAEFDITVFSNRCDTKLLANVNWVKIPLPARPIILRYIAFQFIVPMVLAWHRLLRLPRADLKQGTQGQKVGAEVVYAHFCHRAYLNGAWKASPATGTRRMARWSNHQFNAYWERKAFDLARRIVVPSLGLARELATVYPMVKDKLRTIANPVDLQRFRREDSFDRRAFRLSHGLHDADTVFVFMALGDFARKGLGLILAAASELPLDLRARTRLLVVGGQPSEIDDARSQAEHLRVAELVQFVGLQRDVRPYLWASDLLAFPSAYEIFSLAILQAAAAGLPVLVSAGLYGAEEFVIDGSNGWLVERTVAGVQAALQKALVQPQRLKEMGLEAQKSVQKYSEAEFVAQWRVLYAELMP